MAVQRKIRTGVGTIWRASRKICMVAERYGTIATLTPINAQLATAVTAIVNACALIRTLDDFPFEYDTSGAGVGEIGDGGGDSSGPF